MWAPHVPARLTKFNHLKQSGAVRPPNGIILHEWMESAAGGGGRAADMLCLVDLQPHWVGTCSGVLSRPEISGIQGPGGGQPIGSPIGTQQG